MFQVATTKVVVSGLVALWLFAGCGESDAPGAPPPASGSSPTSLEDHRPEPALWELVTPADVTPESTEVTLSATPSGCHTGAELPVSEPQVEVSDESIVITVTVAPQPAPNPDEDQGCAMSPAVEVTVELEEPIGDRDLVDGGCDTAQFPDMDSLPDCDNPVRWSG